MTKTKKDDYKLKQLLDSMPHTKTMLMTMGYQEEQFENAQIFICASMTPESLKARTIIAHEIILDLCNNEYKLLKEIGINFTVENGKLGSIPSISFSPYITCIGVKCFENNTCFGLHQRYNGFFKFVYSIANSLYYIYFHKEWMRIVNGYLDAHCYKYFRWFEIGDCINAQMFNDLNKIALKHKRIIFMGMTKKFTFLREFLNKNEFSKNLIIMPSSDSYDNAPLPEDLKDLRHTDIIKYPEDLKNNEFLCPNYYDKKKHKKIKVKCSDCLYCWIGKKNPVFIKHQ